MASIAKEFGKQTPPIFWWQTTNNWTNKDYFHLVMQALCLPHSIYARILIIGVSRAEKRKLKIIQRKWLTDDYRFNTFGRSNKWKKEIRPLYPRWCMEPTKFLLQWMFQQSFHAILDFGQWFRVISICNSQNKALNIWYFVVGSQTHV